MCLESDVWKNSCCIERMGIDGLNWFQPIVIVLCAQLFKKRREKYNDHRLSNGQRSKAIEIPAWTKHLAFPALISQGRASTQRSCFASNAC